MRVNAIYLRSTQKIDDKELRERRLLLGLFLEDVFVDKVEEAISEHDLWSRVVAHHTLVDGKAFMSSIPRVITDGVIFESVEEFVQYLKTGVYYEDIAAGYAMVDP